MEAFDIKTYFGYDNMPAMPTANSIFKAVKLSDNFALRKAA